MAAALIGLIVGIVVGGTSTGGGALLTPALVLIAGVPPSLAIGSDVMIASGMKLFGGGFYAIRREVDWPTVVRLAGGSVPGAALGIWILNRIPMGLLEAMLQRGLGLVLILAGASLFVRIRYGHAIRRAGTPALPTTVGLGFLTGLLVSMTSIGSGSLLLCVLAVFYPLRAQTMVGTDLVHALLLSAAATVGHYAAGRVDVGLAAGVLVGAIPGVLIGARLATGVPERALRASLATVLIAIGVQLSAFGSSRAYAGPVARDSVHLENRPWTSTTP